MRPGVEVLAAHEGRPVAVRQGRHLSFTFHPEMTGDLRFHRLFLDGVGELLESDARSPRRASAA